MASARKLGWSGAVVLVATLACAALAQPSAQIAHTSRAIAAENAKLSAHVADGAEHVAAAAAEVARLRKALADMDAGVERIEGYAKLPGVGGQFVRNVVEELHRLPRPEGLLAHVTHSRRVVQASDDRIGAERALAALDDLDAAVARRVPAAGPADAAAVRDALAAQRDLLSHLVKQEGELLKLLEQIGEIERKLGQRSTAARAELVARMFWVPVPPGASTLAELDDALAWTLSPQHWSGAAAVVWRETHRRPIVPLTLLLVAAVLLAARGRLRARLDALGPTRVADTVAALGLVVAIAAPGPLFMFTIGFLLEAAPAAEPFGLVVGDILRRAALLLLALLVTAAVLDPGGIGARHFGWDRTMLAFAARLVRRFTALFVPIVIVGAVNSAHFAPFANRESLGRVGIVVAALILAAFFVRIAGRGSPPMQRLAAAAPRSWTIRLHWLWFGAGLVAAFGIAALAAAGYFIAAAYLFGRLLFTLYLVLAALVLYALMALWVRLQRHALAGDASAAARSEAARVVALAGGAAPAVPRPTADVTAIGEETRALVDLLVTLLLLGGMWLIWRDSVAALSDIADFRLWSYTETVGDKEVTRPLTVAQLFLALVIVAVTVVVVRNVGALVDLVLLRRLEMAADATYAIKVIVRYVLAAVGIVLAAGILGIGWSDVQWLVAALSVGLGFGLQEIFGNFVAGLIVLAERPVRIGDVVTIGDVSGTVARIQARVITIVDFDNKEVLIPNKSLITDRVVNWTLSSQTTRLKIKVDVSRDADLELVQRVILDSVEANPDVLREPGPRVFVIAFAAEALTLEINAFVGSFAKRQRVQHEINVSVARALRKHAVKVEGADAGKAQGD